MQDYEKTLDQKSLLENEEDINNMVDSTYQGLTYSIMEKLQQRYDLMPKEKNSMNVPPKNILSRIKMNEVVVTKPPTETQAS
jgi:hypothetical protein